MSLVLDAASLREVESLLETPLASAVRLAGGDVSGAILVTTLAGDKLAVKRNATARTGMFAAEADGLRRLGRSGAIRVPEVIAVRDDALLAPHERCIVMEYVHTSSKDAQYGRTVAFGRHFGERLATLHRENPAPNGAYGLDAPSFLGRHPLDNAWNSDWAELYRRQRIGAVLPECREALGDVLLAQVQQLSGAIPELLSEMPHTPCLIHGDLWSGNYLVSGQAPVLIDPAAFYGHPEHEWAYIELFGGFPPGMREGYDAVAPLDSGYERRRPLLQLFHILVHVAHFGESYVPAVRQVCRAYGF